jgi:NADH-quinone oxidoreductase subunit L
MPAPLEELLRNVLPFMMLFLPLGGFVVLSLLGPAIKKDKEENGACIVACVTVVLSFACAVFETILLRSLGAPMEEIRKAYHLGQEVGYLPYQPSLFQKEGPWAPIFEWISVGGLRVPFALLLDPLSSVMTLVVTGVGSLIHIYSLGYMEHDGDKVRYFSYLNLFTFFMLVLVTAATLPLMFVGWEGVGLCSYLLIGFWFKKKSASDAGMKAFIVNRIGDVGLILGTILAYHGLGSVGLMDLAEHARALPLETSWYPMGVATTVCLLLFVGACGKSAQIPLHVWLPDAMEGPTPVSALIHAATMVTAGVYLVARLGPLYLRSVPAYNVVAFVGSLTAFMAATIALVQTDIKKVLAYSTVSQLGYMFLACGIGAFGVAIFHLFTHAFFKALLFLGSGSVIHALSGEQDMRKMGGLRRKIPWTFWTFLVGTLAIAGIPPLAGFFSKDEILGNAILAGRKGLFSVGLLTAVLTAFYMGRLLFLVFFGDFRGGHEAEHHIHESPFVMVIPLVLLALGSALGGFVPIPEIVATAFRFPEGPPLSPGSWVPILASLLAALGIWAAYFLYIRSKDTLARVVAAGASVRGILEAKYYFDDVYNWFARMVVVEGSELVLWKGIDSLFIDGLVNGTASTIDRIAGVLRRLQTGLVRTYALMILAGAVGLIAYLLWVPR